ncbi:uncharacterized protein LOC123673318 [Harmonia axyridis]|uniref:uncharacterized protein LOC123673318 n=1 Tax=Harmonia axyridis TaxID=115357 RepID=UPI001E27695A|nr:uncharacterized protein LOC123673318 [Harmonia axyridis]
MGDLPLKRVKPQPLLISDLSKDAFVLALRRFISRKGKPHKIHSDNGKMLVDANSEIQNFLKLKEPNLTYALSSEGIQWKFIPPDSPHFGGLWEDGMKSIKHHMKRVMGNAHLTFEELYSLLTQIEATVNSRPLTPLSTNPSDLLPLTPQRRQSTSPCLEARKNRILTPWKRWHLPSSNHTNVNGSNEESLQ